MTGIMACILESLWDWYLLIQGKFLILLTMIFFPESWNIMVLKLRNVPGSDLIFLVEDNFLG